jgi:hypothetical protein
MEEWDERIDLEKKLEKMSRLEDLQWKQKAGKNSVLQGDANTHFSIILSMVGEGRRLFPVLIQREEK